MKQIIKNVFYVLTFIVIIVVATIFAMRNEEKNSTIKQNVDGTWSSSGSITNNNGVTDTDASTKSESRTVCNDALTSQLKFSEGKYSLFTTENITNTDIKPFSREMEVYGLITNENKDCDAQNIRIKIVLTKDGKEIQNEYFTIEGTTGLPTSSLLLGHGDTAEYHHVFEVYESLLDAMYKNGIITQYKLKLDVNIQIQIENATWDIPQNLNKIISNIKKK